MNAVNALGTARDNQQATYSRNGQQDPLEYARLNPQGKHYIKPTGLLLMN